MSEDDARTIIQFKLRALKKIRRRIRIEEAHAREINEDEMKEVDMQIEKLKERIIYLMELADLTERERQVLMLRCSGMTFKKIASLNKLTTQGIQQTEIKALNKIKEVMRDNEMEPYRAAIDALPYILLAKILTD